MYVAIQNLRAYNKTYIKGEQYDALPKGFEKCFKQVKGKGNVETSSINVQAETRSKKDGGRSKRAGNSNRGKKSSSS